jgi:hypothetical protein
MDLDPVAIDLRHDAFLLLIVARSVARSVQGCEPGFAVEWRYKYVSARPLIPQSGFTPTALPQRTNEQFRKLILLDQFQFGLPLNRNAIMLRTNWR